MKKAKTGGLWFWNKNQALELLAKHLGLTEPADEKQEPVPFFIMPTGTRIAIQ